MKHLLYLCLLLPLGIIPACSPPDLETSCVESFLEQGNWTSYAGEKIECGYFFATLYELDGRSYFVIEGMCMRIATRVVDCEGKSICEDPDAYPCANFYEDADKDQIVGIKKA